MAKSELIARQSRHPTGWLGEVVARVMSLETAQANALVLEQLLVGAGDQVLEVGCGHGRTLERLARQPHGFLAGVDPSEVMVRLARRRLRRWIRAGRAAVSHGVASALPYPDARFATAFAVHVLYFWGEALAELRELRRVVRPGGRVLLGYRPRDAEAAVALPPTVYRLRTVEETEALLRTVGFAEIRSTAHTLGRHPFVRTEAARPA